MRSGLVEKRYTTHACYTCQLRPTCTQSKTTRYIYRWEHEKIMEQLYQRMKKNPEKMRARKSLVEHPFGTIKHWMGHNHFLTRGIGNVAAETSLSVLSYNLKRVLNIVNFKELMAVVT